MDELLKRGVRTRGGRLPPLGLSRGQPQRKSFTPNIPQRRVKVEDGKVEAKSRDVDGASRGPGGQGDRTRGRRGGRGRREFIQTEGAPFGEGVASSEKKIHDTGYSKDSSAMQMPVYRAPKPKTKKEVEEEKIKFENDSDWSSDGDDDEEYFIQLPLSKRDKTKAEDVKSKESIFDLKPIFLPYIKQEVMSDEEERERQRESKTLEPSDVMMLIEFPSRLPFEKMTKKEEPDIPIQAGPSQQNESENPKPDEADNAGLTLQEMGEGFLGKLQLLKSGKMRLVLGSSHTNIELDDSVSFVQEVVSLQRGDDQNHPEMTSLGYVKQLLRCTPDIKKYLAEQSIKT